MHDRWWYCIGAIITSGSWTRVEAVAGSGAPDKYESSITSVSWLPSEAIPGIMRLPFDLGPFSYDDPPPDTLTDLQQLLKSGSIRFANELRAWVDVEDGRVVGYGQTGRGWMGKTKLGFGSLKILYPTIGLADIRPEAEATTHSVRFVQTAGGRPAVPMPRHLNRAPFVQVIPPVVWTTLAVTINADGSSKHEVVGASRSPPLDLRPLGPADRKSRSHRLQNLVR